eukprot:NODE_40_length_35084_cov_0.543519.p28 type:complete len:102 gc:universal NODE_40_length_35084_cov_0.543519:24571-24876(+)
MCYKKMSNLSKLSAAFRISPKMHLTSFHLYYNLHINSRHRTINLRRVSQKGLMQLDYFPPWSQTRRKKSKMSHRLNNCKTKFCLSLTIYLLPILKSKRKKF